MIAQQAIGSIFNVPLGAASVKKLQILVILVFLKTKVHEVFFKKHFSPRFMPFVNFWRKKIFRIFEIF